MDEKNNVIVFKSYLRLLLTDLEDLRELIKNKDLDEAEKHLGKLISDTRKGIED